MDYDTGLAGKPVGDHTTTMIGADGKTPPAPWVPYTRAGCDFGTVASANTELENTLPDVPHVFGANSPEAKEAENPNLQSKADGGLHGPGRALRTGVSTSAAPGRGPTCCPTNPAATTATARCTGTSSSSR